MKFISKNSNLRIVLNHGMPAEPLTGRAAVAGVYMKFENGVLEVKNEDVIEKMKAHPGFNSDYIAVEDDDIDPFKSNRKDIEPKHVLTDIEYGHVGKSNTTPIKFELSDEQKKAMSGFIMEEAKRLAKEIIAEHLVATKSIDNTSNKKNEGTTSSNDLDIYNDDEKDAIPSTQPISTAEAKKAKTASAKK